MQCVCSPALRKQGRRTGEGVDGQGVTLLYNKTLSQNTKQNISIIVFRITSGTKLYSGKKKYMRNSNLTSCGFVC